MFRKLRRRLKSKALARELRKRFSEVKAFTRKTDVRERSVLVIEFNPYHAETLPGHCRYFRDAGYDVDLFMLPESYAELPFCRCGADGLRIFVGTEDELKKWTSFKALSRYDFVFLSSLVYYVSVPTVRKCRNLVPGKYGLLGVEHGVLEESRAAFPEIEDFFRQGRLFTLSATAGVPRLNPHWYGDVRITPRHGDGTTVFAAVGAINGQMKNHGLLLDSVDALLKRGVRNFKVVVVGSGMCEIPERLRPYVELRGRLDFPDMFDVVEDADFLLALLDVSNLSHHMYLHGQASGSVQLSLAFRKPLVINDAFGRHYELSAENAVLYEGGRLSEAMASACGLGQPDYARMQAGIAALAERIYRQSLGDLSRTLRSLSATAVAGCEECERRQKSLVALAERMKETSLENLKRGGGVTEDVAIRLSRSLTCLIPIRSLRRRIRDRLRYRFWCPPGPDERKARAAFLESVRFERETPKAVALPTSETPLVSIVIPVYNNYGLTMRCLASIARNTEAVPFEVVLADDASTDETVRIQDAVKGLRVVRTAGNLRFLRNCNHAAQFVRGKYVLFLNNDTQVQRGWLPPLVAALEGDATIGFVGSMMLNPDLSVQECGMAMARDGWSMGFGGQHPAPWRPAFRGMRDVDYVSGAAIMLATSLWRELGGFDETYAPAYYEDSDLAFRVRARGLRVVCEPASRVIHCGGESAAGGSAGQRSAFEANRLKFAKRWFGADCGTGQENLAGGTHP